MADIKDIKLIRTYNHGKNKTYYEIRNGTGACTEILNGCVKLTQKQEDKLREAAKDLTPGMALPRNAWKISPNDQPYQVVVPPVQRVLGYSPAALDEYADRIAREIANLENWDEDQIGVEAHEHLQTLMDLLNLLIYKSNTDRRIYAYQYGEQQRRAEAARAATGATGADTAQGDEPTAEKAEGKGAEEVPAEGSAE